MTRLSVLFSQANWLTQARIRRIAAVFAILALAVLGSDAWLHTSHGVTDADGEQLGRDFVNYWAGAHLAAQGHAIRAYDINGFVSYERSLTALNAHFKWYSYPPTALVLSLPLAAMDFIPGLVFWLLSGVLVCAALLARTLGWRMALLASFATPASLVNALWGQNGQFTAALLCGGILFLERRPWLAGILFAMLCFKPHLAILVPIALAAGGHWRAFAAAGVMALSLCASVFLLGPDVWAGFLHNAPINAGLLEIGDSMWHRMPTLFAAIRLAGGGIDAAYGVQMISAIAAVLLTIRIWRSGALLALKGCALIVATFLVTPYAWDYDLIALVFAAAWFAAEAARTGFHPWEKSALALSIAMPLIFSPLAAATHIQVGPVILWLVLGLIARRALKDGHQAQDHQRREEAQHIHLGRIA